MDVLEWTTYNRAEEEFHTNWLRPTFKPFVRYHKHSYAELLFVEKGTGAQQINGRHQSLQKGDLILIRPNQDAHCIDSDDDNFSILHIAVQEKSIQFIENRYFDSSVRFWGTKKSIPFTFSLSEKQQEWYKSAFYELQNSGRTLLKVELFLLELMDILSEDHRYAAIKEPSDWLQVVCERVVDPEVFSKGPKVLSQLANKSQEHVSREIKKRLGKTPSEIINEARIEYAKKQLIFSDKEILDIAFDCGFKSLSQFYNVFFKLVQTSPAKFRKRNRM